MGLGFYCDSSVDLFYYVLVMCTVVCNILSFKHVNILDMTSIFLVYELYYYHMCFIITVCAILLLCVLYYYHMHFLSFGGLA